MQQESLFLQALFSDLSQPKRSCKKWGAKPRPIAMPAEPEHQNRAENHRFCPRLDKYQDAGGAGRRVAGQRLNNADKSIIEFHRMGLWQ